MAKATIPVAGPLGIAVHDHIIVGKGGHAVTHTDTPIHPRETKRLM